MCNTKALVQMMDRQKMITQSILGTFRSLFGFSGSLLLCLGSFLLALFSTVFREKIPDLKTPPHTTCPNDC